MLNVIALTIICVLVFSCTREWFSIIREYVFPGSTRLICFLVTAVVLLLIQRVVQP